MNAALKLFTDEKVIIPLKGLFANSSKCYDERHRILLRSGSVSYFTMLIVRDSHQKVLQHGIETILIIYTKNFGLRKKEKMVKDS